MPTIIETTELISKTMDNLIDYIVVNEFLAKEINSKGSQSKELGIIYQVKNTDF